MSAAVVEITQHQEDPGKKQLQKTVIEPPDLSRLPTVDFDAALKHTVTDDASCVVAKSHNSLAKDYLGVVNTIFEEPVSAANKIHKFLTGLRGQLSAKAEAVDKHTRQQVSAYLKRIEDERLALQRRLQAEADAKAAEAARAQREAIERKRKEELANAMPWEIEAVAAKVAEPVEVKPAFVPSVYVAPTAAPTGIATRNKPWTYELESLHELVKAAAADPTLLEALQINDKYLKMKAREMGESLGKRFPGVKGVRETTVRM
jgi:hypothetical protein